MFYNIGESSQKELKEGGGREKEEKRKKRKRKKMIGGSVEGDERGLVCVCVYFWGRGCIGWPIIFFLSLFL